MRDRTATSDIYPGPRLYPAYEEYWLAVVKNPTGVLPFGGKVFTKNEIAYARLADKTPHIVVSRTLDRVEVEDDEDR